MEFRYTSIKTSKTSSKVKLIILSCVLLFKPKLEILFSFVSSDIEIARSQEPKNIMVLAKEIGLQESEVILYGNKKAKICMSALDRMKNIKNGKYIVITGYVNIILICQLKFQVHTKYVFKIYFQNENFVQNLYIN